MGGGCFNADSYTIGKNFRGLITGVGQKTSLPKRLARRRNNDDKIATTEFVLRLEVRGGKVMLTKWKLKKSMTWSIRQGVLHYVCTPTLFCRFLIRHQIHWSLSLSLPSSLPRSRVCVCVCVCACQGIDFNHAQTARFGSYVLTASASHTMTLRSCCGLPIRCFVFLGKATPSPNIGSLHRMCVCVCVHVCWHSLSSVVLYGDECYDLDSKCACHARGQRPTLLQCSAARA